MAEIERGSIDLILCDLPYGTTDCRWDVVIPFEPLWRSYRRILKPNGAVVLNAAQPFASALVMSNPKWYKYEWVWDKHRITGFLNAKKQPLRRHESILVFYDRQPTYHPQMTEGRPYSVTRNHQTEVYSKQTANQTVNTGTRYPVSILEIPQGRQKNQHPTQKPLELMQYLIRTYTNKGDTVLDNCMGSGTTGVACVNTGRDFIGIELDDHYFEVAQRRIAQAQEGIGSPPVNKTV